MGKEIRGLEGECRETDPVSCNLATTLMLAVETFDPDVPKDCRAARFIDDCVDEGCNDTCTPCTLPPDPT